MKRKIELSEYIIPTDLYQHIALHSDLDTLKTLALTNNEFLKLYQSPHFWKDKIDQDWYFVEYEGEASVNAYESILASWEEANGMLQMKGDLHIILTSDVPSFIDLDTYSIYSIKIIHQEQYHLIYKYFVHEDSIGILREKEVIMNKQNLLQLLTRLIYDQHIRYYGTF